MIGRTFSGVYILTLRLKITQMKRRKKEKKKREKKVTGINIEREFKKKLNIANEDLIAA